MSMNPPLARNFEFLAERTITTHEAPVDFSSQTSKKPNISHLKEFYLKKLAKTEPAAAARISAQASLNALAATASAGQPQASGQRRKTLLRPSFMNNKMCADDEELEVMCSHCCTLIPVRSICRHICKTVSPEDKGIALFDLNLKKQRVALEVRLLQAGAKVNVMRHLTQLRYHIDTCAKWTYGCSEIGALSEHTVQQVKQLTATAKVLAPAVYIFSKRIECIVIGKDATLRRAATLGSSPKYTGSGAAGSLGIDRDGAESSVADMHSIVSELDSDCGTQCNDTQITQDFSSGIRDVGNVQDANECFNLKNEDEQRRWFYTQCLAIKLACVDKVKARKMLISDLYARVRVERIPIADWVQWIGLQLGPDDLAATTTSIPTSAELLAKTFSGVFAGQQRISPGTAAYPRRLG